MKAFKHKSRYSYWFLAPAGVVYAVFFLLPTLMSLFFSMTRWTLVDWQFIGLYTFLTFLTDEDHIIRLTNTNG